MVDNEAWFGALLKPTVLKRLFFFIGLDLALSVITLFFAYQLRFNFEVEPHWFDNFPALILALAFLKIGSLWQFRVYSIQWRYFSLPGFLRVAKAHMVAYLLFAALFLFFEEWLGSMPRSVIIIDFFLSVVVISGSRMLKRLYLEGRNKKGMATLIYGTGKNGELVARYLHDKESELKPMAFVEEDGGAVGTMIQNLRVYRAADLEQVVEKEGIDVVVIAKTLPPKELDALFERLKGAGVEQVKLLQIFSDQANELKDISIEDLLARKPKDLDQAAIGAFVRDKRIMVTGAGGSIGSEIARLCAVNGAAGLILVDNSEYNLYAVSEELSTYPIVPRLVSVTQQERMEEIFEAERPQIVIHAAAFKHVPMVEANPAVAVENNVLGTKNCIDLAIKYGVDRFVLVSTDKAVRPTNIMGATKRVCELYAQNVPSGKTKIVSVRFGNVLGSSGSVVPKFKAQIKEGKPLTVTHPEVTRYFMLISEACLLVLQAASLGQGGEVFVLDMGEPVKIADLARKMLRLYNREDLSIDFIGLRPGEKLYEELFVDEASRQTRYQSIYVAKDTPYEIGLLNRQLEALTASKETYDALREIVPEFQYVSGEQTNIGERG